MATITINKKERETLTVNYGEKSFDIPLRGSLSVKEAMTLTTEEGTYSFFKRWIPKDIFNELTVDQFNQIVTVWKNESDKRASISLGES